MFNRDRSRIVSEFKPPDDPGDWDERHTVVLPDGTKFTFENSGNVQRIFDGEGNLVSATEWTEDGPATAADRAAGFRSQAAAPAVALLGRGRRHRHSTPPPCRFSPGCRAERIPAKPRSSLSTQKNMKSLKHMGDEKRQAVFVGSLTRDEVGSFCEQAKRLFKASPTQP